MKLTLNGADATARLKADASGRSLTGLVDRAHAGIEHADGNRAEEGRRRSSTVVNHPITGPLFSGPQEQPFVCMTDKFKLQAGGTLGPPLDANCSDRDAGRLRLSREADKQASSRLPIRRRCRRTSRWSIDPGPAVRTRDPDPVHRSHRDGHDQPRHLPDRDASKRGWNGRLIYTFGGGCEPGWYQQGDSTGGVDDDVQLRMGYAVASNSLNVLGNNCGDVITAETMAMTKEHFIEAYGVPAFTIGWGSSGGSTQQHQIAENYPGLLDGLMTGAASRTARSRAAPAAAKDGCSSTISTSSRAGSTPTNR